MIEFDRDSIARELEYVFRDSNGDINSISLEQFCIRDSNSDNLTFEQITKRIEQEQEELDAGKKNSRISYRKSEKGSVKWKSNRAGKTPGYQ